MFLSSTSGVKAAELKARKGTPAPVVTFDKSVHITNIYTHTQAPTQYINAHTYTHIHMLH